MGTTLTGTTPQDTYDSLIKVTDNGPIGTSLKTLTDGLGNDSALALSSRGLKVNQSATLITDTASLCHFSNNYLYLRGGSAGLSIGDDAFSNSITLVDAGSIVFEAGSAERVRITSTGNVGIGTSSPAFKLSVNGGYIQNTDGTRSVLFGSDGTGALAGTNTNHYFRFITNDAERLRITEDGYVRLTSGSGGIQFNSDTAAANALDDYEEGTFTPTFAPSSGAYGTLTYDSANGKYTKIGNRVDFSLRVTISAYSAGTASGTLRVENLPFTCVASYVGSVSMSLVDNFAANRYPIKGFINDTTSYILLRYMTALNTNEAYVGATDITASSTIRISGTYFTA